MWGPSAIAEESDTTEEPDFTEESDLLDSDTD